MNSCFSSFSPFPCQTCHSLSLGRATGLTPCLVQSFTLISLNPTTFPRIHSPQPADRTPSLARSARSAWPCDYSRSNNECQCASETPALHSPSIHVASSPRYLSASPGLRQLCVIRALKNVPSTPYSSLVTADPRFILSLRNTHLFSQPEHDFARLARGSRL